MICSIAEAAVSLFGLTRAPAAHAGRKHASGNTPLQRIVAEVKACKDVRVNSAHASLPSSSPAHRESGPAESDDPRNSEWRSPPRCVDDNGAFAFVRAR